MIPNIFKSKLPNITIAAVLEDYIANDISIKDIAKKYRLSTQTVSELISRCYLGNKPIKDPVCLIRESKV